MLVKYSPDVDILLYEVSKEPIDYAEEMGDVIVHFSKNAQPVLLEILNASNFLRAAIPVVPPTLLKEFLPPQVYA